jgi:hypothetical protein
LRACHQTDERTGLSAANFSKNGKSSSPLKGMDHEAELIQNAFIESFNARLRHELLNETLFTSLAQVRAVLIAWKDDYNNARPHSALGNLNAN